MVIYQLPRDGTGIVLNGATYVPEDTRNRLWNDYLEWVAAGGTPDPADVETLEDARARATQIVDEEAETLRRRWVPSLDGHVEFTRMRVEEAEAAAVDGSIDPGEYPLLEAEVPHTAADVAAVAAAVLAERDTRKAAFAQIEAERSRLLRAFADSTTSVDVDTALAGRSWPVLPI